MHAEDAAGEEEDDDADTDEPNEPYPERPDQPGAGTVADDAVDAAADSGAGAEVLPTPLKELTQSAR